MKNKTKMLSIVLAIVMILTSVSIGVPAMAASKAPSTQITSIKAGNKSLLSGKRNLAQAIRCSIQQARSLLKRIPKP